jgi:small subunit ribosomal protein S6
MRRYELMLLLRPDLEDDKLQAAVEKVTRAIVNRGGSLSKVSPWGKRRLAYDIERHREASYFLIHFDIEPSQVREIERGMLISEEILRHLVTVLEDRGPAEEIAPAAAPRATAEDEIAFLDVAAPGGQTEAEPAEPQTAESSAADEGPAAEPAATDEPPAADEPIPATVGAAATPDDETGASPADEERAEG